MLFIKPIYDNIIKKLWKYKNISLQDLHSLVIQEENISLSNFYKVIQYLSKKHILNKDKKWLYINSSWIIELDKFCDSIKKNYFTEETYFVKLPVWWMQKYEAQTFVEAETIWSDIYSKLLVLQGKKHGVYSYNAHFYYLLGMPEIEKTVRTHANILAEDVCFVCWNSSFLDQYSIDILAMKWFDVKLNEKLHFPKDWYVLDVIGDYCIEFFMPDSIVNYFKTFFDTVKKIEDFNLWLYKTIFYIKEKYNFRVIHDPSRAEEIRKLFKRKK